MNRRDGPELEQIKEARFLEWIEPSSVADRKLPLLLEQSSD